MNNPRSSSILLAVSLLSAALLPSCSLPPGYAWRQIQRDGLIPFMQNGMSAPKAQPEGAFVQNTQPSKVITPASPTLAAPAKSTSLPPAYAVTGLNGYVRSPFTNPPRLVDVRGMNPGTKVMCPYTQRQFVVPGPATPPVRTLTTPQMMAQTQPRPRAKSSTARVPAPTPIPSPGITRIDPMPVAPKIIPTPAPAPSTPKVVAAPQPQPKPAPSTPKVVAAPQPKPAPAPTPAPVTKPKPKPVETPKVAATTPPPSKPEPKPAPAPAKTQSTPPPVAATPPAKLPFGAPITGRPGFVNSPYAEKHQLVDVTGLSVGTEVKCPYTGKLFRVPPQQQAKK